MGRHFASNHKADGSIIDDLPSLPLVLSSKSTVGARSVAQKGKPQQSTAYCEAAPAQKASGIEIHYIAALSHFATFRSSESIVGPLFGDEAHFREKGIVELRLPSGLSADTDLIFDSKPDALSTFNNWQFGQGFNSCTCWRILGSVKIHRLVRLGSYSVHMSSCPGQTFTKIGSNVTRWGTYSFTGSFVFLPTIDGF